MVLQEIGGSGYDDVQATQPSNPSIGDTWLDTSTNPPTGKIYADLGSGGQWTTDLVDARISTRAAPSDILSDGVSFDGANIDAKISEAKPSDVYGGLIINSLDSGFQTVTTDGATVEMTGEGAKLSSSGYASSAALSSRPWAFFDNYRLKAKIYVESSDIVDASNYFTFTGFTVYNGYDHDKGEFRINDSVVDSNLPTSNTAGTTVTVEIWVRGSSGETEVELSGDVSYNSTYNQVPTSFITNNRDTGLHNLQMDENSKIEYVRSIEFEQI